MSKFTPVLSGEQAFVAVQLSLADPASDALVRHIRLLRDCVAAAQRRWAFEIDAAVVLPNELHMTCCFEDRSFGVGAALTFIMTTFQRHVTSEDGTIWKASVEACELAASVIALRRVFIENAPVRAGLVKQATDWPYSSVHKEAAQHDALGAAVA